MRIFERSVKPGWKELVLIDEEQDLIKIYCQDHDLGFPFSVYEQSFKEYGFDSIKAYLRLIKKRGFHVRELDVDTQRQSEIQGLLVLAWHQNQNNRFISLILNDGTIYNDIEEQLCSYGMTAEEAGIRITEYFAEKEHQNQ